MAQCSLIYLGLRPSKPGLSKLLPPHQDHHSFQLVSLVPLLLYMKARALNHVIPILKSPNHFLSGHHLNLISTSYLKTEHKGQRWILWRQTIWLRHGQTVCQLEETAYPL